MKKKGRGLRCTFLAIYVTELIINGQRTQAIPDMTFDLGGHNTGWSENGTKLMTP